MNNRENLQAKTKGVTVFFLIVILLASLLILFFPASLSMAGTGNNLFERTEYHS